MSQPAPTAARPLWSAVRRDPWLVAGLLVSLVALVVPLWVTSLLPFMDLPQHLATIRILHDLADPAFGMAPYYEVHLADTQYLAYYFAVDALAWLMPLEVANRVVLSLYAAGLPLAMAAYLRAFGRDPAVALLAAPLAYNTFLFMGFVNYVAAFPILLWALAVLRRLIDDFSWIRWTGLVALTVLLFYSHAQPFLLYGLFAGIVGLTTPRGLHPRHWWRQGLHLVPAVALLGVWIGRSRILAGAEEWQQGHGGRNVSPVDVRWEPMLDRLSAFPRQLLDAYRGDADDVLLFALLALGLVLFLFRRSSPAAEEIADYGPRRAWLRERTPEILAVVMAGIYLLSPISYKWIWPISHRLAPLVVLFGLATLTWRRLPARPWLLVVPATALSLWAASVHVEKFEAFEDEAGAVREVVRQAAPGKRLTALIFDRGSEVVNHAPYLHFGQYYVVERGGVATFSFVDFPQSPVRYADGAAPPRLPNRWEWTPHRFRFPRHGRWYDYFLVRDGGPEHPRNPFGRWDRRVELVARQGRWALYRKL
ncbi:MAG: hypothetical protein ACQEXJ_16615 [Myxococcota bacterium]